MRAPAHSSVQSSSAQARSSERGRRMRRATARPTQPAATRSHAPPLRLPAVRQGAAESTTAACAAATGSPGMFRAISRRNKLSAQSDNFGRDRTGTLDSPDAKNGELKI